MFTLLFKFKKSKHPLVSSRNSPTAFYQKSKVTSYVKQGLSLKDATKKTTTDTQLHKQKIEQVASFILIQTWALNSFVFFATLYSIGVALATGSIVNYGFPSLWALVTICLAFACWIIPRRQFQIFYFRQLFLLLALLHLVSLFFGIVFIKHIQSPVALWILYSFAIFYFICTLLVLYLLSIYHFTPTNQLSHQPVKIRWLMIIYIVSGIFIFFNFLKSLLTLLYSDIKRNTIFYSLASIEALLIPLLLIIIWFCSIIICSLYPKTRLVTISLHIALCLFIYRLLYI